MRLVLLRLWYGVVGRVRRTWCRWFGCTPCVATRLFVAGEETKMRIAVTVHCRRCWRPYTELEQRRAVRFFERAGWPSG